jgi:hypothetical protein
MSFGFPGGKKNRVFGAILGGCFAMIWSSFEICDFV